MSNEEHPVADESTLLDAISNLNDTVNFVIKSLYLKNLSW